MKLKACRILEAASYFPDRVLSNADLEKMVETNDAWIISRTGIKERRIVAAGQACSDLALEAARRLLDKINRKPTDIDAIIVATVTPDMPVPSTACILQHKLGATNAWCFDINAACTGFVYGLSAAEQYIRTGKVRNVLLIGSEVMSSIVDYRDRATCILFGDAAAAVWLEGDDIRRADRGIVDTVLGADGSGYNLLWVPVGGSAQPATVETLDRRYVYQDGKAVFKVAVTKMADISEQIVQKHGMSNSDIDFFIPHQANLRIIEACGKRLELPPEKVVVNIERYGNTTSATIPSCLAEIRDNGRLQPGNIVVMAAFGAGFTYGAALVRWG